MRLGLLIILLSLMPFSFARNDENRDEIMNACFITINSSEEKRLFKEKLSSGANKGKFKFHELVPDGGGGNDWFKRACEKNIPCDILVISGHFGGSFFGHSGSDLSMSELETRSCKKDCKGIMSSPKEVFLLGCNTLAGKKEDNRSAAEYLNVLVEDGIPVDEASRIVEQRYGAAGTSFKNSMKRAFTGVPHIYGFHSIGPSGKSIQPLLKKYHQKVPDYHGHLVKVELERGLALMGEFSKWNQGNTHLYEALKITAFTQTSGVLIPCVSTDGFDKSSPIYSVLNNICKLRSDELSQNEAIDLIRDLLIGDDFALYMPVIGDYLKKQDKDTKEKLSALLKNYPQAKENILDLLEKSKTGFGKLKIAKIASLISIISEKEFKDMERKAVASYLTHPVSVGSRDAICSYAYGGSEVKEIKIKMEDLDKRIFSDPLGLSALKCLNIYDRNIAYAVIETAKKHQSAKTRKRAILALEDLKISDSKAIQFLEETLKNGQTKDEQALAVYALSKLNQGNQAIYDKLKSMLKSKRSISGFLGDVPISEKRLAVVSLESVKLRNYEQFRDFVNLAKESNRIPFPGSFNLALANLEDDELSKFLHDKTLMPENQKKEWLYELERWYYGPEKKMPIEFYFYILDEHVQNNRSLAGSHQIEFVKIENEDDAKKFVTRLRAMDLNEDHKFNIINYLPKDIDSPVMMEYLVSEYTNNASIIDSAIGDYLNYKKSLSEQEKKVLEPLKKSDNNFIRNTLKKHNLL